MFAGNNKRTHTHTHTHVQSKTIANIYFRIMFSLRKFIKERESKNEIIEMKK